MYPCVVLKVNILMSRNVIISIHIRDIIIVNMIVTYRAPCWLGADINAYA
jgi:hypothetical protein